MEIHGHIDTCIHAYILVPSSGKGAVWHKLRAAFMQIHIHTYTHIYIYTHTYINTHTYIHTYIHIHAYIHTRMHKYIYRCHLRQKRGCFAQALAQTRGASVRSYHVREEKRLHSLTARLCLHWTLCRSLYAYMYVCMYVCIETCTGVYVCMYIWWRATQAYMNVHKQKWRMYKTGINGIMLIRTHVCEYACVSMHACMYVSYVCRQVCI
jgi:hypothetical protein